MRLLDFFRDRKSKIQILRTKRKTFLCEQDGVPERELKCEIVKILESDPGVERAYLVRVQYDGQDATHVALCLKAKSETQTTRSAIAEVFGRMFNNTQHLDIIYLTTAETQGIDTIATPFFLGGNSPQRK